MSFDLARATELWEEAVSRKDWNDTLQVVRIAGMCGLGVLSIEAMNHAMACVRADSYRGKRFSRELFTRLSPGASAARWARCLLLAAEQHPVPAGRYPIRRPDGHVVGTPPCFDRARKGQWTDACRRAAWGSTLPYGLETAVKPCPRCNREMRYWCQLRNGGEPEFRWSVDHVVAHAAGGCVCHFNLAAICPSCNSSKGKR